MNTNDTEPTGYELSLWVAEHVMGYSEPHDIHLAADYVGSVEGDYQVLCRVRETWDEVQFKRFYTELWRIWERRRADAGRHNVGFEVVPTYYEPGDYSLAAYRAMQGVEAGEVTSER